MSQSTESPLDDAGGPPPSSTNSLILLAIPITVVVVLFLMGIFGQKRRGNREASYPTVGDTLPAIVAAEWINGNGPSTADLAGKVFVLDVWASWCGPCRATARELVTLHDKYKDRGVVFVGLSTESSRDRADVQKFIDQFKISWPNGCGAEQTIEQLAVEWIPRVWVVGKDGRVVWESSLEEGSLEEGIETALGLKKSSRPSSSPDDESERN